MKSSIAMCVVMSALLGSSIALATVTPIYDIQYTTDPSGDSPLLGQTVDVKGIVTAVSYYGQFWLQDASGPWNGVYVYDNANAVALGDEVSFTGTVNEYYNLTELETLTNFSLLSSGNALPAMTVLSTGSVADEQYEGVLVRVEDVLASDVADTYGEWDVDDGSGSVAVGDAMDTYGFEPTLGQHFDWVQGPLDYAFSEFKIQPRDYGDIVPEPASSLLLMLGMACLVRMRRAR
jgi:hypothetical protein